MTRRERTDKQLELVDVRPCELPPQGEFVCDAYRLVPELCLMCTRRLRPQKERGNG